jgi:exonuclease SbcC
MDRILSHLEGLEEELPFDDDGELDTEGLPSAEVIADARATVEAIQGALADLRNEQREAAATATEAKVFARNTKTNLDNLKKRYTEARPLMLLGEALGPTGIPIYEIDAAGPEVSEIINLLLEECYGDRFQVAIKTLSEKKKGGHKEDFNFVISDSHSGRTLGIGQVSGGEKTIVGEAMRIGFALYQAMKSPSHARFETMLRDEAEGSLSPTNARRYVRMLARAKEIGGFHQIFFITHNEYAAASATGRIRVAKGGRIEILKGGAV